MSTSKVSFLGPTGTFSESVVDTFFGAVPVEKVRRESIRDCIESLEAGESDYAVVPVENSTGGLVSEFWEILADTWSNRSWRLMRDIVTNISHHLFVSPSFLERGDSPTEIFSHWQALRQCRKYLDGMYPGAERVPTDSTAEGGRRVSLEPDRPYAAIGHRSIGEQFGLVPLVRSIEDNSYNQTRFVVLGRRAAEMPGRSFSCGSSAERVLTFHSVNESSLASIPAELADIRGRFGWQLFGCYSIPRPGYIGEYNVFMDWIVVGGSVTSERLICDSSENYVVVDRYRRDE